MYIIKPFDMSLPTAAPPPVICVRKPTLIGPCCDHAGPRSAARANTSNPKIAAICLLIPFLLLSLLRSGVGFNRSWLRFFRPPFDRPEDSFGRIDNREDIDGAENQQPTVRVDGDEILQENN